jgi:hypothetical protein
MNLTYRNLSRFTLFSAVALLAAGAFAEALPTLKRNQTFGYGADQLLTFTYTQNFDCVEQPTDDLNHNGKLAQSNPGELQTPICVVGTQPSINPPGQKGDPAVTTEPLYVLVPMFSADNDQNPDDAISCKNVVSQTLCGPALGKTLIALFGAIPEAFKATPSVYAQCPDPGLAPGTCTMHASRLDLAPVLAALKLIPSASSNVFLPTPNHSHIVNDDAVTTKPIWWQVIPVLVLDAADWPTKDGNSGITSSAAITLAEKNGEALEAPSNFFLFFSSKHAH